MVTLDKIEQLVKVRQKNILRYIELLDLPQAQFSTLRKLLFDELGRTGLIKELAGVLGSQERNGSGRNILSKEGGAP